MVIMTVSDTVLNDTHYLTRSSPYWYETTSVSTLMLQMRKMKLI
jgi:hypothetical protein